MLLIDSPMLMYRCYAKMDFLKTTTGIKTGLEYGTLRALESLQKKYPDQKIVLCFDSPKNFRKDKNPHYKANREPWNEDRKNRYTVYKRFLSELYPTCEIHGYEADDVMYSLSKQYAGPHFIYTNDLDLTAAVDDKRQVVVLRSWKSKLFPWDEAKVMERYGVRPHNLARLRAFIGDTSDNLDGVDRLNKKYTAELVEWSSKFSEEKFLNEMKSAGFPQKQKLAICSFINSGLWKQNFETIILQQQPTEVAQSAVKDKKFIVECLNKWEIRKLKLCDEYREELCAVLDDEEF